MSFLLNPLTKQLDEVNSHLEIKSIWSMLRLLTRFGIKSASEQGEEINPLSVLFFASRFKSKF